MTDTNFRVVSQVRTDGDLLDVPPDAHDVTIEPLDRPGVVRVTYLKPTQHVPFDAGDDDDDEPPAYLD
jgi:hypothetical protein